LNAVGGLGAKAKAEGEIGWNGAKGSAEVAAGPFYQADARVGTKHNNVQVGAQGGAMAAARGGATLKPTESNRHVDAHLEAGGALGCGGFISCNARFKRPKWLGGAGKGLILL
jgi:hypothetical protein